MGIIGFCVHFIWLAFMLPVHSFNDDKGGQSAVYPNVWPGFVSLHGGFPSIGLVQPRLNTAQTGFGFPMPFLTGNAVDARATFAIKTMDCK